MTITMEYWDDLEITELFESTLPSQSDDDVLAKIRASLKSISDRYWPAYLEEIETRGLQLRCHPSQPDSATRYKGAYVLLRGVETANKKTLGGHPLNLHYQDNSWWGLVCDQKLSIMVERIQKIQDRWGFERSERFEIVGRIIGTESTPVGDSNSQATEIPWLEPTALRVPGQVALFRDTHGTVRVPGLKMAERCLVASREREHALKIEEPIDMLEAILYTLEYDDVEAFSSLWVSELNPHILRTWFTNFKRTYQATEGRIRFVEFDRTFSPENYSEHGMVRMYLAMTFPGGSVSKKPLWLVKQNNQWRIEKGTF